MLTLYEEPPAGAGTLDTYFATPVSLDWHQCQMIGIHQSDTICTSPVEQSPGTSQMRQKPRMWSMRYALKYCAMLPSRRFHLAGQQQGSRVAGQLRGFVYVSEEQDAGGGRWEW
jgi:hypothetical protein